MTRSRLQLWRCSSRASGLPEVASVALRLALAVLLFASTTAFALHGHAPTLGDSSLVAHGEMSESPQHPSPDESATDAGSCLLCELGRRGSGEFAVASAPLAAIIDCAERPCSPFEFARVHALVEAGPHGPRAPPIHSV